MKNFVKKNVIVSRDSKVVELYMKEVAKYPLLTPEQEVELAKKVMSGDMHAREDLVNSNLRFVLTVAHSYQGQGLPLADLISEGNLGLQKAVDMFDVTKGFRFCSYAVWWIRQSISQAISQYSRMVRLPSNKQMLLSRVNKAQSRLTQQLLRAPSAYEIALDLGVDEGDVSEVLRAASSSVSIDASVAPDDETPLAERMTASETSPDGGLMSESLAIDIVDAMSCLSDMERLVLTRHYGLGGVPDATFNDLSLQLDLSVERVRQIHRKALLRIRRSDKARRLLPYLLRAA